MKSGVLRDIYIPLLSRWVAEQMIAATGLAKKGRAGSEALEQILLARIEKTRIPNLPETDNGARKPAKISHLAIPLIRYLLRTGQYEWAFLNIAKKRPDVGLDFSGVAELTLECIASRCPDLDAEYLSMVTKRVVSHDDYLAALGTESPLLSWLLYRKTDPRRADEFLEKMPLPQTLKALSSLEDESDNDSRRYLIEKFLLYTDSISKDDLEQLEKGSKKIGEEYQNTRFLTLALHSAVRCSRSPSAAKDLKKLEELGEKEQFTAEEYAHLLQAIGNHRNNLKTDISGLTSTVMERFLSYYHLTHKAEAALKAVREEPNMFLALEENFPIIAWYLYDWVKPNKLRNCGFHKSLTGADFYNVLKRTQTKLSPAILDEIITGFCKNMRYSEPTEDELFNIQNKTSRLTPAKRYKLNYLLSEAALKSGRLRFSFETSRALLEDIKKLTTKSERGYEEQIQQTEELYRSARLMFLAEYAEQDHEKIYAELKKRKADAEDILALCETLYRKGSGWSKKTGVIVSAAAYLADFLHIGSTDNLSEDTSEDGCADDFCNELGRFEHKTDDSTALLADMYHACLDECVIKKAELAVPLSQIEETCQRIIGEHIEQKKIARAHTGIDKFLPVINCPENQRFEPVKYSIIEISAGIIHVLQAHPESKKAKAALRKTLPLLCNFGRADIAYNATQYCDPKPDVLNGIRRELIERESRYGCVPHQFTEHSDSAALLMILRDDRIYGRLRSEERGKCLEALTDDADRAEILALRLDLPTIKDELQVGRYRSQW